MASVLDPADQEFEVVEMLEREEKEGEMNHRQGRPHEWRKFQCAVFQPSQRFGLPGMLVCKTKQRVEMIAETKLTEDLRVERDRYPGEQLRSSQVQMKDQGRFHEHRTLKLIHSATKFSSSVRYAHGF